MLDCSSSFTRSGRVYLSSEMQAKTRSSGVFSARLGTDGYPDIAPLDATINVPNAIDCANDGAHKWGLRCA